VQLQWGIGGRSKYALACATFACLKTLSSQRQSPSPSFSVRISVNLVQVDATVTDSHGKPVSGLTAADFQILLDGKPQEIKSCNFIVAKGSLRAPPTQAASSGRDKLETALPPMPAAPLRREDVRRIVVLFVDDVSMSSESVPAVRNGLRKFIEKQLQPGDLAGIVRASADLSTLRDLTTDRRMLLAAANQVRWNPTGRGLTVAVATSLRRLLHRMADLPGRKSVVILSDNLPLRTPDDAQRHVVDESVRAGVVIYEIGTRGVTPLDAQAADNLKPPKTDNKQGSIFLATQTGGFMVMANLVESGIEQVMNDQSGYYLLAFTPPPEALTPGRDGKLLYHRLKVEVRHPGLRVRSHHGFFGVADEDLAIASSHPELQLAAALESPFEHPGLRMEIQSGFLNVHKDDSFIRTVVVLDARDLAFAGPPIHRTGIVHLLVRAFAVSGDQIPGGIDQTLRIDLNEEGYGRALKYGLIYTALLQAIKPGPYQVRAAFRDENTGRIGTAADFIEAPKLKGLVLSGIVFQRSLGVEDHIRPATASLGYAPGESAEFALQVINAPDTPLTLRTCLFRDGERVYDGPAKPIEIGRKSAGPSFVRSDIEIPPHLEPGDYLMGVEVEDQLAPPRHAAAWQWARLSIASPRP
jgi:VWFA-related protein